MKLHHFLLPFVVSAMFWFLVRLILGWTWIWIFVVIVLVGLFIFGYVNKNKRSNI